MSNLATKKSGPSPFKEANFSHSVVYFESAQLKQVAPLFLNMANAAATE